MPAIRPSFRVVAATLLPLLLATCTEDTLGPIGHPGLALLPVAAVTPSVSQYAGLTISQVRAVVTKPNPGRDGRDTLLVKTAPFPANSNALTLDLTIPLTQSRDSVDVELDYLSGVLVVFSGSVRVEVRQGPAGSGDPVPVPVTYVGPGAAIATIVVTPQDSVVRAGSATTFRVAAVDSSDEDVAAFYVSWSSSSAGNPIGADGILHAGTGRGTFFVLASTPTGIKDSAQVTVEPAPSSVVKASGDGQTGLVGTALALPLLAEVRGADNLPIQGASVTFAVAAGGGAVDTATVVTGANGRAGTTVRLGTTAGANSFTATVTGAPAATFTATAVAAGPTARTWTGAVSTDWFTAGNWSGSTAPTTLDTVLVPNTVNKPTINAADTVAALTVQTGASLTITAGATIVVNGTVNVAGTVTGTNGGLTALGALTTTAGSTLSPSVLTVGNTLTVGGNFNVTSATVFQGTNQLIPANVTYSTLEVTGSATLTGRTTTTVATVIINSGHLTLGGHTLITGLFQLGQAAGETSSLVMTNALDSLIAVNVVFNGGSTAGTLTAGVLVVGGNFNQTSLSSSTAFAASGSHRTVFNSTSRQTLTMASPGAALSHFNILDLSVATGGVSLTTNAQVATQLVALPGVGGTPVIHGTAATTLTAAGVNVNRLIVDTIPLVIGGGTLTRFDSVSFLHQAATATVLTVNDAGTTAPYSFNALSFGTVPTTGFYLRANDTDGAAPNALTIDMIGATPATPGGFTQINNGAVINWPPIASTATWNGTVSTNWQTAANWTPAGVPDSGTNITIPAGTPNAPTLSANLRSGSLTVSAGAVFNLGFSQLVVYGNALIDGTINGGGNIFMGGSGQVRGGFPFLTVAGPVTAVGPVNVANNLNISGGDYNPNGNYTVITGALTTLNGGTLTMTSASDSIQAQATNFSGNPTTGKLTAGVLRILGDFGEFQGSGTFAPSGTHTVRLFGTAGQLRINDSAASFFQNLDVSGATNLNMVTPIHVRGVLTSVTAGAAPVIGGAGFVLTTVGVNITRLTLDTVTMVLNPGPVTAFSNVTFSHQAPTATQLTVTGPGTGTPYIFTNTVFQSTPTTGGLYLSVNDNATTDGLLLGVNMVTPTPAAPGAFSLTTGGAALQWPATGPAITWTGATSTAWTTASNWNPARVPTASDSVVIPNTVTTFPTLTGPATVAAIFEDGRLNITGGVLHVTRSANATAGGINKIVTLTGATDSLFVGDSTSVPVSGAGVLVASGSVTGGLGSTGTLVVLLNGTGVQSIAGGAGAVLMLVRKPSGSVAFTSSSRVDSLDVNSNIPLTGTTLLTDHGLFTAGSVTLTGLTVGTSLSVGGSYAVGVTNYNAAAGPIQALPYTNLTIFSTGGAATLTGRTTVSGSLQFQSSNGGTLALNGHTLAVTGNFLTNGINGLRLVMTNPLDSMLIGGSAEFDLGSIANPGNLTAGTLVVAGDFTETSDFGGAKFQATGTHKTVLTGNSPTVTFESAGTAGALNRFQDLTWTGTGTMTMDSTVLVSGTLTTTATGTITFLGNGTSQSLQVGSYVSSGPTVFSKVAVSVVQTGTGTPFSLNNATFTGLPVTATQLTIQHPGLATPITLSNLSFSPVPTTGFYLSATDNNPSNGIGLTLDLGTPTPATPSGLVQVANGAVVNWPAAAPTFTWQGATSAWTTGTNWSTGTVPGPADKVVIVAATAAPIITAGTLVGALTVNAGGSLTVTNADLQVNGSLSVLGTLTGTGTGTVVLAGHNFGLGGIVDAPIRMTDGYSLTANLTLAAGRTLDINSGGIFSVNGHTVTTPRLTTQGNGQLIMTLATDSVIVSQAAIFDGGDETNLLFGGVLVIGDTLSQPTPGSTSFVPSGSHKTVFNGTAGVIDLVSAASTFAQLDVSPTAGIVRLIHSINVSDVFSRGAAGTLALDSLVLQLSGNAVTLGGTYTALPNGRLQLRGAANTLQGPFTGAPITMVGSYSLNGTTTADVFDITQTGNLTFSGNRLTVTSFSTFLSGVFNMLDARDTLVVNGPILLAGGSTTGRLNAGAIKITGDFNQSGGVFDAFAPSGTSGIAFEGTGAQAIHFANPGPAASHFHDVLIDNGSVAGVTIDSVYVLGTAAFSPLFSNAQRVLHGVGGRSRLILSTLSINRPTTFDNLAVGTPADGSVVIAAFDSVTFTNTPATDTALTINHPGSGGPFTFHHLSFQTTPTGAGAYIRADDTDGATPTALTLDIQSATPATPGGLVQTAGGAVINWPAALPEIWVGAISNTWETAANWSGNAVPSVVDPVTIPAGTPFNPILASNGVAATLTVDAGATLDLGPSGALTVAGNVSVPGAVTGTASSQVTLTGTGTLSGNFDALRIFAPASYTLAGDVTATRPVTIAVGAALNLGNHTLRAPFFSNAGAVTMAAALDSVVTAGDQLWDGASELGLLTAGTVVIGGNFNQGNTISPNAFAASGSHKVVFNGSGFSQITMASPGVSASRFQNLDANKSGGATLAATTTITANGRVNVLGGTGQFTGPRIEAQALSSPGSTTINPNYLQVSIGDSLFPGNGEYNVDTVSLGGGTIPGISTYRNLRLGADSHNNVALTLTDGSLILAGGMFTMNANVTLARFGALATDVLVGGGGFPQLNPNGHTLVTPGKLTFSPGGLLIMTNAADSIDVGGDASFAGEDEFLKITAGKLVLRGNMQQLGTASTGSFRATGAHQTIFAGSTNQSVAFANWGQSALFDAIINKTGGTINFSDGGEADGATRLISPTVLTSDNQYITNALKVAAGATVNVPAMLLPSGDSLQVLGDYTATFTHFQSFTGTGGGTIPSGSNLHYTNITSDGGFVAPALAMTGTFTSETGDILFNGQASIGGDLIATTGGFIVGGQTVMVAGNFQTRNGGHLTMNTPGDSLNVAGDVTFAGGDELGHLTFGTLVIGGNFQQSAITSTTSFAPGGTHRTSFARLEGSQNAFFDSPGSVNTGSHFQNLDVTGAIGGGINLNVNTNADGTLIMHGGFGQINGGGATLTVHQLDVNEMIADNVTIALDEQTVLVENFDFVTFQNMPTTGALALSVRGAGGNRNIIFAQINFPTLPVGAGNLYVKLVSTNGQSFQINMQNSDKGGGPGATLSDPPDETIVNGAQVIWTAT